MNVGALSKYITKASKNPKFLRELYSKQNAHKKKIQLVSDSIK